MYKFSYINIREYLVQESTKEIGEADLRAAISDFSCPRNLDVETFLKKNASFYASFKNTPSVAKDQTGCLLRGGYKYF